MSVWMSLIEFSLTTTMRGILEATLPCIFTNEYHRPTDQRLRQFGAFSISSMRSRVIGWCSVTMVGNSLLDAGDPVAEALVVVDEVELAGPPTQRPKGPVAERQRLGEDAGRELGDFEEVLAMPQLPVRREAAGIVVVEQVEAGELVERHARVEDRVRLAAEDLDRVPELDERLRQVAGVDPLPADVRFPAVSQVGDAQRLGSVGGRRHRVEVIDPVTER